VELCFEQMTSGLNVANLLVKPAGGRLQPTSRSLTPDGLVFT
jgi:hypothetical protein